jgi:hypothetical protein
MSKRTVKFNLVKKYKIKFSSPFFLCGSQILIVTQEDKIDYKLQTLKI